MELAIFFHIAPKLSDPPVRGALAGAVRRVSDICMKKEGSFDGFILPHPREPSMNEVETDGDIFMRFSNHLPEPRRYDRFHAPPGLPLPRA